MASPDATQGKNAQQKQEKSKNEWFLQDHSRVVGNPEVIHRVDTFPQAGIGPEKSHYRNVGIGEVGCDPRARSLLAAAR
jgi:hypothetical protein